MLGRVGVQRWLFALDFAGLALFVGHRVYLPLVMKRR